MAPECSQSRITCACEGYTHKVLRWWQVALCISAILVSSSEARSQNSNIIQTVVGGGSVIPNSSAPLTADVPGPVGVVKNAAGDIYFSSSTAEYLYELSASGALTVIAGQGYAGFGGDGGPATQALVASPSGMAIDGAGDIYFADITTNRVRMINTAGVINTVAGSSQLCIVPTNKCGDGGPATSANLYEPQGLAVDASGNLYIADSLDNRIRRVDAQTGIITTVAGTGDPCSNSTSACGDGGAATSADLNTPFGIAVDASGNLYIADTFDHRIRFVNSGGTISTYAGTGAICNPSYTACGDGGSPTAALLHLPKDVVLDSSDDLYIADTADHRIRMVNSAATVISTVAGLVCSSCTTNEGFSGDRGSPTAALLNFPRGLTVDNVGNIVIADGGNQRIRVVSAGGSPTINTIAGGGSAGDGGPPTSATLAKPLTVVIEPSGNYLIADQAHHRIRRVTVNTGVITTVAGSGIQGYSGDKGPATQATLNTPFGVTVDAQDNIYIADSYNSVVRKVNSKTGVIITYAGNGNSCFPSIGRCGDGGLAVNAQMTQPTSLAIDGANNLLISDYFGQRIRQVNASTQIITTAAGSGAFGFAGDGGPAKKAEFKYPFGVAADATNDIYIADDDNDRVRWVNGTTEIINTYALDGSAGFGGDGGPALSAAMGNPLEVALDPSDNLFIAGGVYNVVRRVDLGSGTIATVAGTTQNPALSGFSGDGGPATQARMSNAGVAVDGAGDLYIADTGNNRIRYVLLAPVAAVSPASLQFAPEPLNTTSNPLAVELTNSGSADLTIAASGVTTTGNFAQTNNCGSQLAPLQSCTINVTVTPTHYGRLVGTLTIQDNSANSPQTVALSGSGPAFDLAASPTSIPLVAGQQGTSTMTVTPLAGFDFPVSFSCSGLPTGGNCAFVPSPLTLNGISAATSVLTLTTSLSTPTGSYNITVTATSQGLVHKVVISLKVSSSQAGCTTSPPSGTCPAPSSPTQVWCAGNNALTSCPGGTSWVGFSTSQPASGSWSGQLEGLDAASILSAQKKPGPQPDPNGGIGPTNASGTGQYLEFADNFVQAFDRATGNGIFSNQPNSGGAPQGITSLFAPGGVDYCSIGSFDGIATYDRIDGVFVVANIFHPVVGNYYYCIGVSAPSGAVPANNLQGSNSQSNWNVYAYAMNPALPVNAEGNVYFPDYARFGTWSDGFYVTWDLEDSDNDFDIVGFEVCKLDKTSILAGLSSAPPACYTYIPGYAVGTGGTDASLIHTLMPADYEGNNAIPADTAGEYFLAVVNPSNPGTNQQCNVSPCTSNQLAFWTWSGFGTGAGPTYITLPNAFTPGCYNTSHPYDTECVPEPYGGVIDSLGDRLNYRLAYRYLSTGNAGEYLAVAHTVQESSSSQRTGIRYYQIQAGSSPTIAFTGDVQDTVNDYFLFMPSVAMDQNGDVGITYSVGGTSDRGSANNYDPSPFFVTVDNSGNQGTPVAILSNSGSSGQDETDNYWGEYVSVSSDPNDDLTFWAVDEYMNGNQTSNCSPTSSTGCAWASRVYTCRKGSGC